MNISENPINPYFDRNFQNELLHRLAQYYPHSHVGRWHELHEVENVVKVNVFYLMEHGLIDADAKVERRADGGFAYGSCKITKKGMDFIAKDGGLSAVFGVQVVQLHDHTVRELIALAILKSDADPVHKRKWIDALQSLPAESIKHLTMKMIDLGLDNLPHGMPWLTNFFQQFP